MHERTVIAHKEHVQPLLKSPDYEALFHEVTGAQMNHHFGSQIFADGPDAIPTDFHTNNATYEDAPPVSPADPSPPVKPYYS